MRDAWLAEFVQAGFTVCRGLVDNGLVSNAQFAVKQQLCVDLRDAEDHHIRGWTNRTFVPSLQSDDRLLDLYRLSPLATMCQKLVAPFSIAALERAQLQVRLSEQTTGTMAQPVKHWHCDGVACPHLPEGQLNSFQLLVGVLLSDLPHARGGAVEFRVGGHRAMAEFFRSGQPLPEGAEVPRSVLELPTQAICGAPGDVVISHHLTPHSVGANESSVDRLMVYFRIRVLDHDDIARRQLADPWIRMPNCAAIEEQYR
ncbi:phytanoyl-CoA dioxygenase family protein [Bradyrhizobium yuanmingense]|uniref:phytanoyl-CoA dioxygenase family protein n=1 Tax=Bradyrhizobium yuanmingense TaxID=108015 RepID=UPI0023B8A698|nr:phytanoyl-CoA dioxygenase family protein [Bradyrhizobium yuanmingense]MDF0492754.1 phytanoyl-CoA dioxygenase family protein [Bradyrhizobium yuanmingense]